MLPLGTYSFGTVTSSDPKKDMSRYLQIVDRLPELMKKEKQKLKLLLVEHQVHRWAYQCLDTFLDGFNESR